MFKSLKQQYKKEELSFLIVKKLYPQLAQMTDNEILLYLECESRANMVQVASQLKKSKNKTQDNSLQSLSTCACIDAKGNVKDLYVDELEAKRMSKLLSQEQNMVLNIYLCPASEGWHLTKG